MKQALSLNLRSELSRIKVGVLAGGISSEAAISRRSGSAIARSLQRLGFQTLRIDPAKRQEFQKRLLSIDVAFIALHGLGGEDGKIQQILDLKRIPYVGSSANASRRAFDKVAAKRIFVRNRIPTPDYCLITQKNWQKKLKQFHAPFVLKPIFEGSSFGVIICEEFEKFAEKIKCAVHQYGKMLVEKKIVGREITVGVLEEKSLPVVELKPKSLFYSYKAKYTKGMTRYLVPAPISAKLTKKYQTLALRAHKALGLKDLSRVDMMLDEKNRPYVLEVNTIPGFTELSLLPKAAKEAGISFDKLCGELVVRAFKGKIGRG